MGKGRRNRNGRGPQRPRADLLENLAESHQFLDRSASAFDDGCDGEAKRLAVTLRVLLHDTQVSHSLLKQLEAKDKIRFLDTAEPINPGNLLSTSGFLIMRMTQTNEGAVGEYIAPLGDGPPRSRVTGFDEWWKTPVMKLDATTWSREDFVLSLANQEGGGHVDPNLNESYQKLAKKNGLGWEIASGGKSEPLRGNAVSLAVRQITYEYAKTVERESFRFALQTE